MPPKRKTKKTAKKDYGPALVLADGTIIAKTEEDKRFDDAMEELEERVMEMERDLEAMFDDYKREATNLVEQAALMLPAHIQEMAMSRFVEEFRCSEALAKEKSRQEATMLRTARRPQVSAKVAQTIAKVTATSSRAAAAAAVEAAADSAAAPVSHARATAMLDVDEEEDGTGSASSSASSRGAASRGTLQQLPPATPGAARLRGAAAGGVGANVPASSLKALKPGAGFAAAASLVLPADENLDTGVGSSSSSSSSSFLGGSSKSSASSSSSASHAAPTDSSLVVELSLDDPATSVGKLTEAGGSDAVFSVMGSLLDGLFKAASAGNKSLESVMASSGLNPSLKAALMAFAAAEKSGAASSTGAAAAAPPAAPAPRTNMKLVATVSRAGLSEAPQRTAAVAPPAAAAAAPVAAPRPAGSKLAAVGAARSGR